MHTYIQMICVVFVCMLTKIGDCSSTNGCANDTITRLYDNSCVASDCSLIFQTCENNSTCAPYATSYINVCDPLFFLLFFFLLFFFTVFFSVLLQSKTCTAKRTKKHKHTQKKTRWIVLRGSDRGYMD